MILIFSDDSEHKQVCVCMGRTAVLCKRIMSVIFFKKSKCHVLACNVFVFSSGYDVCTLSGETEGPVCCSIQASANAYGF